MNNLNAPCGASTVRFWSLAFGAADGNLEIIEYRLELERSAEVSDTPLAALRDGGGGFERVRSTRRPAKNIRDIIDSRESCALCQDLQA